MSLPKSHFVKSKAIKTAINAANGFDDAIEKVEKRIEMTVQPLRKNAAQRFPTLFLLAVTFGITTTAFGTEQLLSRYNILMDRPLVLIGIGVLTLIITGTAYKKM